ncbi:MAG TPA: hypothetical protein VHE30_19460, partial [Polyangiaceae bacterium]|nr:hypothetical protein [Polyangiaceae bacterium]
MKGKIGTALALSFTAVVFGGGACSTPSTKGDSESHFLHECVETCASGLECLCGICTRTCTDTSQCASLAATAECAAALESACAAHGKQCDVPCLTSDACRGLGAGYSCVGGRC